MFISMFTLVYAFSICWLLRTIEFNRKREYHTRGAFVSPHIKQESKCFLDCLTGDGAHRLATRTSPMN